jgi:hypothetical protein
LGEVRGLETLREIAVSSVVVIEIDCNEGLNGGWKEILVTKNLGKSLPVKLSPIYN